MRSSHLRRIFSVAAMFLISGLVASVWGKSLQHPPTVQNHGGPDYFGYTWIDNNNEPHGPVFQWIDIASEITNTHVTAAGGYSTALPIGFNFPFYGADRTNCYVSVRGDLLFSSPLMLNRWMIHVLTGEFSTDSSNVEGVYKWSNNRDSLVVTWIVHTIDDHVRMMFQVIALASGDMVLQYSEIGQTTQTFNVGLEAGLRYLFLTDSTDVATGAAIRIYFPGNNTNRKPDLLPEKWSYHCYPNPFNGTMRINIMLPQTEEIALALYNTSGEYVRSVFRGTATAGSNTFHFNASGLSSGNYILCGNSKTQRFAVPVIYLK